MKCVKRGIAFSDEMQTWIYRVSRLAKISENRVIVRMLQIAREDVAPFDDAGLRRIFREPWETAKKYPALARQMRKRSHGHLHAVATTRLTAADKVAVCELAKEHRTTVSGLQRQLVEGFIARSSTNETAREKLRS